jgi:hypothetical protein
VQPKVEGGYFISCTLDHVPLVFQKPAAVLNNKKTYRQWLSRAVREKENTPDAEKKHADAAWIQHGS